ncbi:MAG: hypothetical protein ACRDIB_18380 [Ardenticatenaceae bacterium]
MESQVVFTRSSTWSTLPVDEFYKQLTFEEYRAGRLETIEVSARELQPDYLTVTNEPSTEAQLTKQASLADPAQYAELATVLAGGAHEAKSRQTLVGAGLGTWERSYVELAEAYARQPGIDFINIHIYPVNQGLLDRALEIADIALRNNKKVVLGEIGLYKIRDSEIRRRAGIAGSVEIYSRDVFAFWQPLDMKFLEAIYLLSQAKNVDYISYFWNRNFFAYLDYQRNAGSQPRALMRQMNQAASQALRQGEFSETGLYYQELARRAIGSIA